MITLDLVHDLHSCSSNQAVIINQNSVFFGGAVHVVKMLAFKCYMSKNFSQVVFRVASDDNNEYLLVKSFNDKKSCDDFLKKIVA